MFSTERRQVLGGGPALKTNQIMLSGACPRSVPKSCRPNTLGALPAMWPPTGRVSQWPKCLWAREQKFSATGRKNPSHHYRAGHTRCNLLGSKEHWKALHIGPKRSAPLARSAKVGLHRILVLPLSGLQAGDLFFQINLGTFGEERPQELVQLSIYP